MKKLLAIVLAIITAFSCCVLVFAGGDGEGGDVNVVVNIDNVDHDLWYCEYCGKACGSKLELQYHYDVCDILNEATHVNDYNNVCEYCGESFLTEAAFVAHYNIYNHCANHVATCPYTDNSWARKNGLPEFFWDYNGGGCGKQFTTQSALEAHKEHCDHKNDYTTWKKIKLKAIDLIEGLVAKLGDVDWGSVISKVVELVKKIPFKDIISKVSDVAGDIDLSAIA